MIVAHLLTQSCTNHPVILLFISNSIRSVTSHLHETKQANQHIECISDCHGGVENGALVLSGLVPQLAVHGQDVEVAGKCQTADGHSGEESTQVGRPPLHWVVWPLQVATKTRLGAFEDNDPRQERNTQDTARDQKAMTSQPAGIK